MRLVRSLWRSVYYDVPERYEKAVFNANANLFEMVNYYASKAFSTVYADLVGGLNRNEEEAESFVRGFIDSLEPCDVFAEYHFPVDRKIGVRESVKAIRAYHGCSWNSTTLGGLKLKENLSEETMRGLAALSTYRNACYDLDVAGAFGGLQLSKAHYEPEDLQLALSKYADKLRSNRGAMDVLQTSLLSTSDSKLHSSGKDFNEAGAKTAVAVLLKTLDLQHLDDKTFILHGINGLGTKIGRDLNALGAKCIGVLDRPCSFHDSNGIMLKELLRHMKKYGTMLNFRPKVRENDGDKIFGEECDILVLADEEVALNFNNAERVTAKTVLEASVGPVTPIADKILNSKEIVVVPSILAGSGKALMAYFDYMERGGGSASRVSEDVLLQKVHEVVQETLVLKDALGVDLRTAAYVKAIKRLFNVMLDLEVKKAEVFAHQKE
ncbi:PREDICTED: glutamate dehydrogenase, mitochondrial-like [Nicrophorus vespilloides]|uniref:Glutamate dehydrogenase, mitochondrial-like n=1 Tax=Nicrophorus vespilloides TaxID=110193 RepID=A0ABM1MV76_NICVS|nr:PREDICTED: glutamate dehydrogenase, mitochondrial-like [Nicrophorus vespilloides]